MAVIKSPINYTGNKYKLLKQILPLFPQSISTFYDIFGGSGTVLINVKANEYIYNDINNYVAEIFKGLVETDYIDIVSNLEAIIAEYELSKTNEAGFNRLRDDYNNGLNDWVHLYTLMCHSFNHQFRFNNSKQYNSSFGHNRSYFSDRQRKDLRQMKETLTGTVKVTSLSFDKIDYSVITADDFVYFDPPYFNSVGVYNDGKRGFEGWTAKHEQKLLQIISELDKRGIRIALSNNFKYSNTYLAEWLKDNTQYRVHYLKGDYVNCNYQKLDRTKDIEVLITNYDVG